MKRNEALITLSREHHRALVSAKRINDLREQADAEIEDYWAAKRELLLAELQPHFQVEEACLLPLLSDKAEPLKERLLEDHANLRKILNSRQASDALCFAQRLMEHVRFEERELFPWLEQEYGKALADSIRQV
ncbi:hemerythrin domain-containing protein [Neptuniibacter halophilus]|uniref:hemerythrin domain-containing protein n=1 Tax=Neptuniibacter halophilus TaxID=651666 RepID=UPI00257312D5|nr:hemerythrin domain-containing protein [Neptuniibacter halophilus]